MSKRMCATGKQSCLIALGLIWLLAESSLPSAAQSSRATSTEAGQFKARLIPKKGLIINARNIPITAGSEINFFTPDKKQHEYYFTWWEQDADSTVPGRDVLYIGSDNTAIGGQFSLIQKENKAQIVIDCNRNDRKTGKADVVYTKLWSPYFTNASWKDSRSPLTYEQLDNFFDTVLYVYSPLGDFRFSNSHPFRIKKDEDPSPYALDYNHRAQHLLLVENDITTSPDSPVKRQFNVTYAVNNKALQDDTSFSESIVQVSMNEKKVIAWPRYHYN
ncbi:MAG: hypothetical protein ACKOD1_05000, partial [Sphingomonadales bacterium]